MNKLHYTEVKVIELQDWDAFVEETYGKIYSFQQQDDCKERGCEFFSVPTPWEHDFEKTEIPFEVNGKEMGVSFETWLNTDPEETKKEFPDPPDRDYSMTDFDNRLFWDRNFYPHVSMIINDLHAKGLLEEGKYAINIDW